MSKGADYDIDKCISYSKEVEVTFPIQGINRTFKRTITSLSDNVELINYAKDNKKKDIAL